jgi:DNA-binding NarL/FixJ family response regulator
MAYRDSASPRDHQPAKKRETWRKEPSVGGSSIDRLSPREREIVRLVARGLANKEIARALDPPCAEETVKTHLREIFAKLDVVNRAQLGAHAAECNGQACAAAASYVTYGNLLWATVPSGGTSGSCTEQAFPVANYC